MDERFSVWFGRHFGVAPDETRRLRLDAAFEVFLSRLEAARARGAHDPLVTITGKAAGGNSRCVTRRMLQQLGCDDVERRALHRIFAGSTSGWPGVLRMFAVGESPTTEQRRYVRRQVLILRNAAALRSL